MPKSLKCRPEWNLVEGFLEEQHAPWTRRIYASSVRKFERWCGERKLEALPADPETVAMFRASEAQGGMRPPTIARHAAAIRHVHLRAGYSDPGRGSVVRSIKKGISRSLGKAQVQKQPATLTTSRPCSLRPMTLRRD